ncbi:MAG: CIA30 family protein [Thiobacillus sp.]|nr:CIA30 family protein [Thiobacillus sp.]
MRRMIDDRSSGDLRASIGTDWRVVTDTVMGGVSSGSLVPTDVAGRSCLRLSGDVSLENNGGFVQASLDLSLAGALDARDFQGIELDVYGNRERYNLHLRTLDTRIVWQSFRASFIAEPCWQTVRLPFSEFRPYRIDRPLDLQTLRRLGVVAIGRTMQADLCIARIVLYQEA